MTDEFEDLLARSSLGGTAWCARCYHPDAVHNSSGCTMPLDSGINDQTETFECACEQFLAMTPEEWRRWRRGQ